MRSLLFLVLLAVLTIRNDAAEIQVLKNLYLPQNISPADPNLNITAPIDPLVDVDEFLIILDGEEPTLDQNGADPKLPAPINLLIDTDEEEDINRANLSVGTIGSGDSSLYRTFFNKGAIADLVQVANINISAPSSTIITAIRATEQGTSQNARATITAGGLGRNTVSIRLTSARGRGFHYLVQVWGR